MSYEIANAKVEAQITPVQQEGKKTLPAMFQYLSSLENLGVLVVPTFLEGTENHISYKFSVLHW